MQGRRLEERDAAELLELVARLERSGLAERRADVRQLLESSRSLLRPPDRPAPAMGPAQRAPPSVRRLAGKLGAMLALVMDGLVLALCLGGILSIRSADGVLAGADARIAVALALVAPGWILLRRPAAREGLREAGFRLLYHLAWGYDWFAEAFSRRAMRRVSARLAARDVMWGWRQHRRALLHLPTLADVTAFLDLAYGSRAAAAFRQAAERLGRDVWSPRGAAAARRLAALRWSALIGLFGELAGSGALWPEPEAAPVEVPVEVPVELPVELPRAVLRAAPEPAAPPPEAEADPESESREATQRRVDLRDLIRRKRQDITTAYGWKLKTEAEIAQRDAYLRQTRQQIARMERDLAAMGG